MADASTGIIVALVSLLISIIAMFAHLVRTMSRIELKTEEMWSWFIGAAREGLGRRKTDRMLIDGMGHARDRPGDDGAGT